MTVLTTSKAPQQFLSYFKNKLLLPDNPELDSRVSFHTDLSLFSFGDTVICSPFLYDYISQSFSNIKTVKGEQTYSPYPHDVAYNAALVGKTLFCNEKYTSQAVIEEAKKRNIRIADVSQGYAKCSIVAVSENALITSDASVKNAAEKEGKDVLWVTNEGVFLDGFEYGFIGGASFCTDDEVVFSGDLTLSPYTQQIIDFIAKYNKKTVFFPGYPLCDIGSPAAVY